MINNESREELHQQVLRSVEKGAKLILGGKIPNLKGSFYPPTLLVNVKPGMAAFDDELFGPVAVIISAKDEAEAIELANKTNYGLGAAIFTRDIEKGEKIATEQLEAGSCFVNDFVKSDPRLPFGGIKESGYGRELSHFGIQEFVNIKSVVIQ
jgi:succinate-semialdehyde dehydrogenase/glutarate-semialdehyde dehydrogenase